MTSWGRNDRMVSALTQSGRICAYCATGGEEFLYCVKAAGATFGGHAASGRSRLRRAQTNGDRVTQPATRSAGTRPQQAPPRLTTKVSASRALRVTP